MIIPGTIHSNDSFRPLSLFIKISRGFVVTMTFWKFWAGKIYFEKTIRDYLAFLIANFHNPKPINNLDIRN